MANDRGIVKACVLIRTRPGQHYGVAEKISSFKGVKSAFAVIGGADVVARLEVENMQMLTRLGIQIGDLPDVVTTETLVAAEE
jgi:DNA-binding Lrp family transcriptional regulator